ncbi:hypothetical protein EPN28_01225 [Patescibacteria group bacterium]|nr:MAG: hypothetical protein EPN28_01225 [Patescibacteria group bacterium]
MSHVSHTLLKNARLIFTWGIIFALAAGGISLLFPKQYAAESQVLVISRDRSGVDPYTQVKSAERIGENLAQVMKTTDFYNKVMELTVYPFNKDRWLKLSERGQRKRWKQDVQAGVVYGTGLLDITVYSFSKDDARALSDAVTQTVASRGWEYLGGDVALKVVNDPLISRWPARPDIGLNIIIGLAAGVLLSALWVARYKKHSVFGT